MNLPHEGDGDGVHLLSAGMTAACQVPSALDGFKLCCPPDLSCPRVNKRLQVRRGRGSKWAVTVDYGGLGDSQLRTASKTAGMGACSKRYPRRRFFRICDSSIKGAVQARAKAVGSWRFSGKLQESENRNTRTLNSKLRFQTPRFVRLYRCGKAVKTVISVCLWNCEI